MKGVRRGKYRVRPKKEQRKCEEPGGAGVVGKA